MELLTQISVRTTKHSRIREADLDNLEFGKQVSDHMLVCDYENEDWQQPAIVPFANLSMSPATLALHYGQTVFEGMKAFRMSKGPGGEDGRINIFRIDRHYDRLVRSLDRMCMAIPPREVFYEGLTRLVEIDKAWVPAAKGSSLYIRPFVYASEAKFGIKVAEQYRFVIFTGPVPELYAKPIRVKVETTYIRAARGGTGYAKCGGNYGGALYPTQIARNEGYDQVLWTDSSEHQYIEESGSMNVMFVINGKLVTPPLSDSILDGVTRECLLILAADLGYEVVERPVPISELEKAFQDKTITEAFGAGTAAVVAPIETINMNGVNYFLPEYGPNNLLTRVKQKLERIRTGSEEDTHGWNHII
ncbi:MAG TPA: branched-chain amino acid aminotransferase [Chitinophagaceae bacterium]|nr:branched-chain amino acid aminotransferase [Chitinophagaceae bacterium]